MSFISRISEEDNDEHSNHNVNKSNVEPPDKTRKKSSDHNRVASGSRDSINGGHSAGLSVRFSKNNVNINSHEKMENSENSESFVEDSKYLNNLREQLYDAVVRGQIETVEALLDLPYADINMTWYSENLLMCALRAKQEKMAEFLIHRGIDVSYEVDLFEFKENSKTPIRYEYYSCRQMAYDNDMPNIVTLIDFFHDNTNKKIVKYIGRKLLKTNEVRKKECIKLIHRKKLLEKRLIDNFIKKEDKLNDALKYESLENGRESLNNLVDIDNESILYDEAEEVKPISSLDQRKSKTPTKQSTKDSDTIDETFDDDLSSIPMSPLDVPKLLELDAKHELKFTRKMNHNISKKLEERAPSNLPLNLIPTRKDFTFKGYKIEFNINYVDDTKPKKSIDITKSKVESNGLFDNNLKTVLQSVPTTPSLIRPKSKTLSRLSVKQDNQIFVNKENREQNYRTISSLLSKSDYLNNNNNNNNNLNKIDTVSRSQSRPLTSLSTSNRSHISKANSVAVDKSINNSVNTKLKQTQKTNVGNFKESYLNSLKKSGLSNEYCVPIIRSKHISGVISAK